jgi:hypothetical protein
VLRFPQSEIRAATINRTITFFLARLLLRAPPGRRRRQGCSSPEGWEVGDAGQQRVAAGQPPVVEAEV